MADSSITNETDESLATTAPTAMQANSESSLEPMNADISTEENSHGIESTEEKDPIEVHEENDDDEIQGLAPQLPEETANNVDSSTSFHSEQDQQTYANLEPILVAMELGQEILQGNDDQAQVGGDEGKEGTVVQMEVQQADGENISQSDSTIDAGSNVVAITQEQLASLFANSGTGGGGNVIVTSLPDGNAGQGGLSIATILQDVVSGIQQNNSNAPATVLTDSSGNPGSYYLVTQGGTIPIVMSSNSGGMNLVQASSTDPTTFVTVNPDTLPEGVEVMPATDHTTDAEGRSTHLSAVQGNSVGSSGIGEGEPITETVSSDHELASAAAAVENDRPALQEAVTSPVPIVTTSAKRRLSNGPRVCEQCNKAFKYPSDLKKHLQIHTDIKKFKCDACNRFFRRLHQLVVHQRIHSGEKPYICKHCGTAFRHDSTLTMHVRTRHEHKRPFKCTYCEHTFGRLSHLRKHVKKVCGPNKQEKQVSTVFQCKFCEEVFPSKIELRKHTSICEKKESKTKPSQVALHVCNICNKDFASPYNVRRHQLTHSDDRPFECEYCNKSFKEKSSLTKHVKRVHLGKSKEDEPLEENPNELVVSISNQDQHLEVVSMSNDDTNLLTATLQSGVSSSSDSNAETTTVDSSALVQVAASVMVEELMHGDDQHDDATSTTVSSSDAHQNIFMTEGEKTDMKIQEADSYNGHLVSDATVSCMEEGSTEVASNDARSLSAVCNTGQDPDSSGMHQSDVSNSQFEGDLQDDQVGKPSTNNEVDECSSEPIQAMVLGNDPEEEVVTSTNEPVSL